jgi:hypothetical protein
MLADIASEDTLTKLDKAYEIVPNPVYTGLE